MYELGITPPGWEDEGERPAVIRFPGVAVFKIRQAARSLQMGGVGFYPRSGFVHLDTGPIRYW